MEPVKNITLLCFMLQSRTFFGGIPYTVPAYQTAVEEVTAEGKLNISIIILSRPNLMVCDDLIQSWYLVPEFYYTKWDRSSLLVLFLSGCEENPDLRILTREWDILLIGSSFNGNNPSVYPTALSFTPGDAYPLSQAMLSLFEYFSWTDIVVIHESNMAVNPIQAMIQMRMQSALKLLRESKRLLYNFLYIPANSTDKTLPYEELLVRVKPIGRVIVLIFPANIVRMFMITAHRLEMTNEEFVYIVGEPFKSVRRWGTLTPLLNDTNDAIALNAFPSLLQVTSNCIDIVDGQMMTIMGQIRDRGLTEYNALYDKDEEPSPMVMAAYFAVKSVAKIIAQNRNASHGKSLAKHFYNRTFTFPGASIFIDRTGIRVNTYCTKAYNPMSQSFQVTMTHKGIRLSLYPNRTIDWRKLDNRPPLNVPECGYSGNAGPCLERLTANRNLILLVIIACGGGMLPLAVGIRLIRKRHRVQVEWWILDAGDLTYVQVPIMNPRSRAFTWNSRNIATEKGESWTDNIQVRGRLLTMASGRRSVYYYKGHHVWTLEVAVIKPISSDRDTKDHLHQLRALRTDNLVRTIGIVDSWPSVVFVMECPSRGNLNTFMEKTTIDSDLRIMLIHDLLKGVASVHASAFLRHGYLSPLVCGIDRSFVLKIAEVGLYDVIKGCADLGGEMHSLSIEKTYIAPELEIHKKSCKANWMLAAYATAQSDVYSVGRIIAWITEDSMESEFYASALQQLAQQCQSVNRSERPGVREVLAQYRDITHVADDRLVENLLRKMETYSGKLEQLVYERTLELHREQMLSIELLREMLPKVVVQQLVSGIPVEAELFNQTSVSFTIMTGFQEFCASTLPGEVVDILNIVYSLFDGCLKEFDAYKVETVSDCYMAASGLPVASGEKHASEMCGLALDIRDCFQGAPRLAKGGKLQLKIGIQSGPCAAGVVGNKRPRYCLFGTTVNTASRLAYSCEALKVHIGEETKRLIGGNSAFQVIPRGVIELKGFGGMPTSWLQREKEPFY